MTKDLLIWNGRVVDPVPTLQTVDRPKPSLWQRFLEKVGLRKPPPDTGVREPRAPRPSSSGGVATLELPETDEDS